MEWTGLDPDVHRTIQAALVITNDQLEVIYKGFELIVHQPDEIINKANDFVKNKLKTTLKKSERSKTSEADAEFKILEAIRKYSDENCSPLCGNSIWQDRRFIVKQFPNLNKYLHYRNIDVSSIKELYRRWRPDQSEYKKKDAHTALEDIKESISELEYYRKVGFIG